MCCSFMSFVVVLLQEPVGTQEPKHYDFVQLDAEAEQRLKHVSLVWFCVNFIK